MKTVQHAIRNRFKGDHKHDKHDDHENYHRDIERERSNPEDLSFLLIGQKDMDETSVASTDSSSVHTEIINGSQEGNGHLEQSISQFDDRAVYEQQLTQLQEQLVAVMIENQTLSAQLQQYETNNELDNLKKQLHAEKERCEYLQNQLKSEKKSGSSTKSGSSSPDSSSGVELAHPAADSTFVDGPGGEGGPGPPKPPQKWTLFGWLWERAFGSVYGLLEDLEPLELEKDEDADGAPLTVKQLKENIKRFKTALTPYINTFKGVHRLMTWKSPGFTLLVFSMYMYTVYQGLFLPFTLLLLTFRLGINYLRHKGFNIQFNYLDPGEPEKKEAEEKGMSDKFNLVLFVARKVQNILGSLADSLEKIKNLLIWEEQEATKTVFWGLFFGFILSCIFEASLLMYLGGLYIGVKLFIIDFIYNRYPRLKQKRDTVYKIWISLPTDLEVERRSVRSEIDKYILPKQQACAEPEVWSESQIDHMTRDDKSFCELFTLPLSECPLPGWHGGKRCTLINKDKSLTGAFKNGRLYLTRSFLCFERSKSPTPKNIVIPLSDIAHIEKAKPYAWMPGGGMAIEISVTGSDKTLTFGALLNRDEVFYSIVCVGKRSKLPWANDPELVPRRHSLEN